MRTLLLVAAFTTGATSLAAQTAAELCAMIGQVTVGQWAEYRMTAPEGTMEMRFAIVGKEAVNGKDHYWHEMKMASPQGTVISQVLVSGYPYEQADIEAMVMKAGDQPAMKMPKSMLSMMQSRMRNPGSSMGDALKQCTEAQIVGRETIEVPAGTLATVHFRTSEGGQGEGWVSTDIPFGLVKLIWEGRGEMVLLKHGKDAKSSITETPMEMPGVGGRR